MTNLQDKKSEHNTYQLVAGSFSANSKFKTGILIFTVLVVSSLINNSSVAGDVGWPVMASQSQTANIFRDSAIGRCNGNSSFSSEIFLESERCFIATSIPVIEQFARPLFESTLLNQILNFGFGERINRQRIEVSCNRIFGLLGQSVFKPTIIDITNAVVDAVSDHNEDKKSSDIVPLHTVILANTAFVVSIITLILVIIKHRKERQEQRKRGIYVGK
jgi:hypothetical protein